MTVKYEGVTESWTDWFGKFRYDEFIKQPIILWIMMKLFMFYGSIMSIIVLMLITRCRGRFRPIRERINLAPKDYEKEDYLSFIGKDYMWFNIWYQLIILYVLATWVTVNMYKDSEEHHFTFK